MVLPDVLRSTEVAVITHRSTNLFLWNYEFELFGSTIVATCHYPGVCLVGGQFNDSYVDINGQ